MRDLLERVLVPEIARLASIAAYDTKDFLRDRLLDLFEEGWSEVFNTMLWNLDAIDRFEEDSLWHSAQNLKYQVREILEEVLSKSLENYGLEEKLLAAIDDTLGQFAQETQDIINK